LKAFEIVREKAKTKRKLPEWIKGKKKKQTCIKQKHEYKTNMHKKETNINNK